MPYVTGSAANITQLKTALLDACSANGWTVSGNIISKTNIALSVIDDTTNHLLTVQCGLSATGTTINTPTPMSVYVRRPLENEPFTWPMTYYIHVYAEEVYLVMNWGIDKWHTFGFGVSPIPGMPGTGTWVAGTAYTSTDAGGYLRWTDGSLQGNYFAGSNHNASVGLFLVSGGAGYTGNYVYHGLTGWSDSGTALAKTHQGSRLLTVLDNPSVNATGQTVLVPIQPWVDRTESKVSLVADLKYSRYVRLDTLNPGDIITLGSDRWKVYPVYKKNASDRTGGSSTNVLHSGTHAYAIKYDGA